MKRIYGGSIAGLKTEKIKAFIGKVMTLRVYADEGEGADDNGGEGGEGSGSPSVNYEDLIAKARKEEKDKQYKTIERLKGQIATLTEQHNNDLLVAADLKKQIEAANKKLTEANKGDSEEVATLKTTIKSLEDDKAALDKKVKEYEANKPQSREEIEKEVRAELEAEFEVRTYKAEKMAEFKDVILVPELVGGNTKEDIDKSIEAAKARSEEIRKQLGLPAPNNNGGEGGEGEKKKKRTPKNPSNPSSGGGGKEIDLDYLNSLDVRSKEYAEVRKQLGLA